MMTKSGLLDKTIPDDSFMEDDESEAVLADLRNSVQILDAYTDMISDYENDVESDETPPKHGSNGKMLSGSID